MSPKRKMDVEAALRFAYRDELPKRGNAQATAAGGQWDRILKFGTYGTHLDEGWAEPGHPPALGDPHPDALRIEQAVRGLAGISGELDPEPLMVGLQGFGLDAVGAIGRAMQNISALVAIHARLGKRPDAGGYPVAEPLKHAHGQVVLKRSEPRFVPVRWERVLDAKGRAIGEKAVEFVEMDQAVKVQKIRSGLYPAGTFCTLVWHPSPAHVLLERAEYAVWWAALDLLAGELVLDTIEVAPMRAPQSPWLGEVEAVPTVHVNRDSVRRVRDQRIDAIVARLSERRPRRTKRAEALSA